jgi:hypothetical protein
MRASGRAATPAPTSARPIRLVDLRENGVVGLLGRPLGTMVTVSGVAMANDQHRKGDDGEPMFLRITSVDGARLPRPVDFAFRKAHDVVDVPEPMDGKRFTYRGFETGRFEGVPLDYGAPWQTRGFSFASEFLVLPEE